MPVSACARLWRADACRAWPWPRPEQCAPSNEKKVCCSLSFAGKASEDHGGPGRGRAAPALLPTQAQAGLSEL